MYNIKKPPYERRIAYCIHAMYDREIFYQKKTK